MKLRTGLLISIVLHLVLIALLALNYQFSKIEIKSTGAAQPKINAKAVNSKRVEQLVNQLKTDQLNKKQNEQQRLDNLKKAEEKAKRKRKEEENRAADAIKKQKAAEQKRKAEEKKAEDLKKKRIKDEKDRKKKADDEKKLKAETERKKKLAEEKKQKAEIDRKNKAEAERKRKLKEEKERQEALDREMQQQMESEAAELAAAQTRQTLSEVDKFNTFIENKIKSNWFEPENKGHCIFRIKISPGGLVIGIDIIEGANNHCESGKRAIMRAEPLPMSRDPDAFEILKVRTFKLENESKDE